MTYAVLPSCGGEVVDHMGARSHLMHKNIVQSYQFDFDRVVRVDSPSKSTSDLFSLVTPVLERFFQVGVIIMLRSFAS